MELHRRVGFKTQLQNTVSNHSIKTQLLRLLQKTAKNKKKKKNFILNRLSRVFFPCRTLSSFLHFSLLCIHHWRKFNEILPTLKAGSSYPISLVFGRRLEKDKPIRSVSILINYCIEYPYRLNFYGVLIVTKHRDQNR